MSDVKISRDQVKHIAKLVRLGITEQEQEKFQKDLSSILSFIEKLNEVDTKDVEPTAHITGLLDIIREDQPRNKSEIEKNKKEQKKILENIPDKKDNAIKVKAIFE